MAFDFGGTLENVLNKGLDIWVDTEKAKNYAPGAQAESSRMGPRVSAAASVAEGEAEEAGATRASATRPAAPARPVNRQLQACSSGPTIRL